jgi:mannose-6-phosphate isomerase-like protein (cupin superfamily)
VPFVDASVLTVREPKPGWKGRFFHSEHMTFAYYEIDEDAPPLHEHHHEQEEVWHVLEGSLRMTIGGEEIVVGPGCAGVVPAGAPHSAVAQGAVRAIVVDTPRREPPGG